VGIKPLLGYRAMPQAQYQLARNWKKERCFAEAVKRVLDEQWTMSRAALYYGVTRPRLSEKVKAERERREQAKRDAEAGVPDQKPLVIKGERRRVPPFEEFDRLYFGNLICPDCGVHHETPDFHRDIIRACRDDSIKRLLINLPPYHSKSTLVTVKDTVYDIVCDPNMRTLLVSKSLDFARDFVTQIAELLSNEELYDGEARNLIKDWGPFRPVGRDAIWNRNQLYVAGRQTKEKGATVQAIGVGGQVYGRRAEKIKCDDIADLQNQSNPDLVQQMLEWLDKMLSNRIGRNGKLIYVGTRVAPADIYSFLDDRPAFTVLRYPCILDEAEQRTLWPDHFPYEAAVNMRESMQREADFQLIYQNVDVPGLGASFTQDIVDLCKDDQRVVGHYEPGWVLIAGLDPAGGNKDSGYTAGTLEGIDLRTGKRFLVDAFNVKSMRAPRLKDQIFDWCDNYPIYAWRVENNGLQSQLVQYNEEIITELANKGIRVEPHNTHKNKWDPQFGVESMAPLYSAGMVSIPWGNEPSRRVFQPMIEQLLAFPMGSVYDLVMSHWFADLGCRDLMRRSHLPMFDERQRVPERIKRRRRVVDFGSGNVRPVPAHQQRPGVYQGPGARGYRRLMLGNPHRHRDFVEPREPEGVPYANRSGFVNR
jgi:hypothetical protein